MNLYSMLKIRTENFLLRLCSLNILQSFLHLLPFFLFPIYLFFFLNFIFFFLFYLFFLFPISCLQLRKKKHLEKTCVLQSQVQWPDMAAMPLQRHSGRAACKNVKQLSSKYDRSQPQGLILWVTSTKASSTLSSQDD